MIKKLIIAGAFMALAMPTVSAQTNFNLSPKIAIPGESVKVTYNPGNTPLEKKKNVSATVYQFIDYKWEKADIKLVKKDSVWTTDYLLPANAALVAFKFKSGRVTDIGHGYGWILSSKDGKSIPGGYAGWAFLRNGTVPEYFPDYTDNKAMIGDDVVLYWMQQQVKQHPSSKRDVIYPWLKVLKKVNAEKAKTMALKDINYLNSLTDLTVADLTNIQRVYAEILDKPASADSMRRVIASIDSTEIKRLNPEKLVAYKAMTTERDYKKVLPMHIDFLKRYPKEKADRNFDKANWIDYAKIYGTICVIASTEKDIATYKEYLAQAPFGSLSTIFYRCMKVPYVSLKTFNAEEAYTYARPAMDRLLEFNDTPPDGYMNTYLDNAGVYADILMHLGKDEPALGFATAAQQKYQYEDSPLNEVSAILLERGGQQEKLKVVLESSMKKNQMTPLMLEMLKKSYLLEHKSEEGYQAYLSTLKDETLHAALEAKVKKSMIKKAVPDFSVRNNKGKVVKLSALKGKVIVLDFWASWCAPCKAAFPGMKMAVDKYKNDKDIAFLFVDTQEKRKDYEAYVTKYLKDNNYDFEVLFDADAKFSKSYGVGPIPHKMVIDKNGLLRFSEVGYMGSPSELVDEISMMVELARKSD